MENFNRVYNDELAKYAEEAHLLVYAILNHAEVRAFVYEVCKQVLHGEGEKGE